MLDDVGLDAITIRRLAERIGVQPGALYRHFTSKRELLDAMVERIVAEAPAADMTGHWAAQVRSIAAMVAVDTVVCYVNGYTMEEQARGNRPRDERDLAFQAGLDLIITGVEAGLEGV